MGIKNLLLFLKPMTCKVSIAKYRNCTVGIDALCWMHRGSISCANELILGKQTDKFISFIMKMIHMLLHHHIKPIMVFDGGRIPIKYIEERSRQETRRAAKQEVHRLLEEGRTVSDQEVRLQCMRGLNVTKEMVEEVLQALRKANVKFYVAPYEADAQLAYLCRTGVVDVVISEDSDLLAYGCPRVIFKMDMFGEGEEVEITSIVKPPFQPLNLRHITPDVNTFMNEAPDQTKTRKKQKKKGLAKEEFSRIGPKVDCFHSSKSQSGGSQLLMTQIPQSQTESMQTIGSLTMVSRGICAASAKDAEGNLRARGNKNLEKRGSQTTESGSQISEGGSQASEDGSQLTIESFNSDEEEYRKMYSQILKESEECELKNEIEDSSINTMFLEEREVVGGDEVEEEREEIRSDEAGGGEEKEKMNKKLPSLLRRKNIPKVYPDGRPLDSQTGYLHDLKKFNRKMFIGMCVLSGSDYTTDVHINGLGIRRAFDLIVRYKSLSSVLKNIQLDPNWKKKMDLKEFVESNFPLRYLTAEFVFTHHWVYDPKSKTVVSLGDTFSDVERLQTEKGVVSNKDDNSNINKAETYNDNDIHSEEVGPGLGIHDEFIQNMKRGSNGDRDGYICVEDDPSESVSICGVSVPIASILGPRVCHRLQMEENDFERNPQVGGRMFSTQLSTLIARVAEDGNRLLQKDEGGSLKSRILEISREREEGITVKMGQRIGTNGRETLEECKDRVDGLDVVKEKRKSKAERFKEIEQKKSFVDRIQKKRQERFHQNIYNKGNLVGERLSIKGGAKQDGSYIFSSASESMNYEKNNESLSAYKKSHNKEFEDMESRIDFNDDSSYIHINENMMDPSSSLRGVTSCSSFQGEEAGEEEGRLREGEREGGKSDEMIEYIQFYEKSVLSEGECSNGKEVEKSIYKTLNNSQRDDQKGGARNECKRRRSDDVLSWKSKGIIGRSNGSDYQGIFDDNARSSVRTPIPQKAHRSSEPHLLFTNRNTAQFSGGGLGTHHQQQIGLSALFSKGDGNSFIGGDEKSCGSGAFGSAVLCEEKIRHETTNLGDLSKALQPPIVSNKKAKIDIFATATFGSAHERIGFFGVKKNLPNSNRAPI